MNYKNTVREIISEIIHDQMTPTMKYYAFDWDDNLMYMPTKIYLKDDKGNSVGMSTEDFAEYRTKIGEKPFKYEGHTIVDFDDNSFKNFRVLGDKLFMKDSMTAETGPAWSDFVEAVNNGSIFAIVTARGHTPSVIRNSIYNLIKQNKNGLSSSELVKNLKKYRELSDEDDLSNDELIKTYLDMCKYYPVTFGEGSAANPEELKVKYMKEFMTYVKQMSHQLQEKAFMKNKISNYFNPFIGFSDDDIRNVNTMRKNFPNKDELKIYATSKKGKEEYE